MYKRKMVVGLLLVLLVGALAPPLYAAPRFGEVGPWSSGLLAAAWQWFVQLTPGAPGPVESLKRSVLIDPDGSCGSSPCPTEGWVADPNGNKAGWIADPNGSCDGGPCPGRGVAIDPNGSCGGGPCPARGVSIDPDGVS